MHQPLSKLFATFGLMSILAITDSSANGFTRLKSSFNQDWLFQKGSHFDARFPETFDRNWRKLDLPHDWAIEGPFDKNYSARAGGLPSFGVAWYRKHFTLPEDFNGKSIAIEFDGAMANSKVYLNGHFLGARPNGYIGFAYDLTPFLGYGQEKPNVISVELSPEDLSSRWYPGAGIYRNVWLHVRAPIHIDLWGVQVTTPSVSVATAAVQLRSTLQNNTESNADLTFTTEIYDPNGKSVARTTSPAFSPSNDKIVLTQNLDVESPQLWDLHSPRLYRARTLIHRGTKLIDEYETSFGIRSIRFDNEEGFLINNRRVKLQGVCLHHDLGPLGTAVNRRAIQRQLETMKAMGANAIRTSHNPPAPEMLQLCDEMGLLVQVEAFDCWEEAKVKNDYAKHFPEWHERDLRDLIRRDRNHPSVIMWSIGNEILEQFKGNRGAAIARKLNAICHEEDGTRPTTAGFNYYPESITSGIAAEVDIVGFNYHPASYQKTLKQNPDWIIYGSETASTVSSRGVYHLPIEIYKKHEDLQVTSYDLIGPPWAYPPEVEFHFQETVSKSLGEFIWTGIDYLGEPTPYGGKDNHTHGTWSGDWPARSSYFGAVDLAGFPKDRFYLYQAAWTKKPMVHLLPHWNWQGREGESIPVFGYTNCDEAELFLNGKSLGRKNRFKDAASIPVDFYNYEPKSFDSKFRLRWDVPFQAGELKIVAYHGGHPASEKIIRTASTPSRIALQPDRQTISADGLDLSFITVRIEDENGNLCPLADNLIKFQLNGPGEIVAVGNGNAATIEPFQANYRRAFNGLCLLVVRSEKGRHGKLEITARAEGLSPSSVSISLQHD